MIVGIDLGTTFSVVGHVNAHGMPALIPDFDDPNEFRTPSVVHVGRDGALVGQPAEDLLEDEPETPVARFSKLAIGTNEPVTTDHTGKGWPATPVAALILRKLRRDAEAGAHEDVEQAIISVPSHFGDAERRATKEAGRLAGLAVPALVEEPVAAATYYGMAEDAAESTMFVYDMGGGTFDATVMKVGPDGLFVLGTEGGNHLGGKAIDDRIIDLVKDDFLNRFGSDPTADDASKAQLRRFAEQVKVRICQPNKTRLRQSIMLCGQTYDFAITRSRFEDMIAPILEETVKISERCLAAAAIEWSDVDRLLLAGGSTMMPIVADNLQTISGCSGNRLVCKQPHQAVGYGAAMYAQQLCGEIGIDVAQVKQRIASYDLGLRVMNRKTGKPEVQALIKRNTALPADHTMTIYTTRADQTRVILELVQARNDGDEVKSLGHFAFGPISKPRKNYPIEMTVAYDTDGLVTVGARDPESGKKIEKRIEKSAGDATDFSEWREIVRDMRIND